MALRCYNSWFGFGLRPNRNDEVFLNNGAELLEELITYSEGKSSPIRIFSAQELEKATNNYADDLFFCEETLYKMYKGTIDGRAIIVSKSQQSDFISVSRAYEVAVLSRINHVNILKILGCCLEIEIPTIVYDFFSQETLYDRIHKAGSSCYISWENCLKIATGVAYGLTYLHIDMATPIIHRNIKSRKILLDEHSNVKIIGFDLSLPMPLGETETECSVLGTYGYADPCYVAKGLVSEKSDVYSYGVVVLEILTGKKDRELWESASEFAECTEEKLVGFAEAILLEEGKKDQLKAFAQLVRRCLSGSWEERPTMKEVVQELRRIKGL
ncbi:wall-associated receptor kinase-like 1 isoform X4 [Magnolia sinica]|uniref:wall-associated receptor kinase-like 1 isoform X4 n=1 Tax=Magnolia sinica TaxID=86752 RepID=UPI0026598BF2|nr:wall-associated receptor kinase-like 1 isoform X4 [Magnolia sinica]XP_058081726.1 wall-associated receptor kinase-like 1 isoform X4 [Magnolia sinica]XP_058081727.1 wall-associated receptor kinase-like 1 isoform X4 [Magnolia sinica]XP_058081728.1 wall-associated receptor kinase-like 1 isoform X4 [Magnolia sinica]XP_058081729.1 wall-associated receptor kinase-like 1 isoform X4 [Magnolia sinica]XP_058081730.1 wall-associated receptor kinase-like 1 isoform X4 [Magnolia sinica]